MKRAEFQLESLTCPSCIKKIEGAIGKINGITNIRVLFNSSKVKLNFDEVKVQVEDIKSIIKKLGYEVLKEKVS